MLSQLLTRMVTVLPMLAAALTLSGEARADSVADAIDGRTVVEAEEGGGLLLRHAVVLPGQESVLALVATGSEPFRQDGYELWQANPKNADVVRITVDPDFIARHGISTRHAPGILVDPKGSAIVVFQGAAGPVFTRRVDEGQLEVVASPALDQGVVAMAADAGGLAFLLTSEFALILDADFRELRRWRPNADVPVDLMTIAAAADGRRVFILGRDRPSAGQGEALFRLWTLTDGEATNEHAFVVPEAQALHAKLTATAHGLCALIPRRAKGLTGHCWSPDGEEAGAFHLPGELPGLTAAGADSGGIAVAGSQLGAGPIFLAQPFAEPASVVRRFGQDVAGQDISLYNALLLPMPDGGFLTMGTTMRYLPESRRQRMGILIGPHWRP